jgi:hypothetical protein
VPAEQKKKKTTPDEFDPAVSQLEDMWDRMLSRGDDDFQEAFHRSSRKDQQETSPVTHMTRKRRRGI